MKRHVNIPIFIPHLGCPNQCVFCNQRAISGVERFNPLSVKDEIEKALLTVNDDTECEIAFFGGSFTGIERETMISILEIADGYIKSGRVSSVRCSTRPDYIDEEIITILKKYGVKTVELGLQSVSDDVLSLTKRGHTLKDESRACEMIVKSGLLLVGQMMIGLPGATLETELETAEFIIRSGASGARIYPTVVFRETELCRLTQSGSYVPLSLSDAVDRTSLVMKKFIDCGVNIIRVGLCASDNLLNEKTYFAGPNHPAIGELCENRLYYNTICEIMQSLKTEGKKACVTVPKGALSKAIGQRRINKIQLQNTFLLRDVVFTEDQTLSPYVVRVELM